MAKQPVVGECFEEVFLEYLRLRFEVEPLPHYVMAAMHLCDGTGRDYPAFVRAFMTWFAESFLFDQQGVFPTQSHNADPADHRWRRFGDCLALLEGWRSKDLKAALEAQADRLELVERVTQLRAEPREDAAGKAHRARAKKTMTDTEVDFIVDAVRQITINYQEWGRDYVYSKHNNEFLHKDEAEQKNDFVKSWFQL